jgi:hypothetical protein
MKLEKAALVAALAEALFALLPFLYQGLGFGRVDIGVDSVLLTLVSLALATFLFTVYRYAQWLSISLPMRLAGFVAAIMLGIENLPGAYRTAWATIVALRSPLTWEVHPVRNVSYALLQTIPDIAAISLVVFLLILCAIGSEKAQAVQYEVNGARQRLRNASGLGHAASVLTLGDLLYFALTNSILMRLATFPGILRIVFLISLGVFFIFSLFAQVASRSQTLDNISTAR